MNPSLNKRFESFSPSIEHSFYRVERNFQNLLLNFPVKAFLSIPSDIRFYTARFRFTRTNIMGFTGTLEKCKACDKTVYFIELVSADGVPYHKKCFKCSHCNGLLVMSSYSSIDGVLYCKPHYNQLFKETANFTTKLQSCEIPFFVFLFFNSSTYFWNWFSTEKDVLLPILPFLRALTLCFCILSASGGEEEWPACLMCVFPITQTKAPSKLSSMFSGTQDKCASCKKTAYPLEKVSYRIPFLSHNSYVYICTNSNGNAEVSRTLIDIFVVTVEGEFFHKTCFRCSHGGCFITPSSYAALDGILYCKAHFSQLFKQKGSYSYLTKTSTMKKNAVNLPEEKSEAEQSNSTEPEANSALAIANETL
ncbi:hypothetical protein DKX38_004534 [Salix brachista]|uniref:LIM zinc-binding domain-containing protein n=1 Tax=Salix brachista TaxID=2182728 RepID=A0A5N5NA85_9ROSI|nr:hypothetical protein DKX38_004534 [Salix brachista]